MYTTISLGRLVSAASPSWLKIVENFRWSGHANGCCKPKWRNDWKSFGACCRPALGDVRREQIRCLWRCLNPYKVGPQKNGLKKMVAIALITCNRPWIVGYRNTPQKMWVYGSHFVSFCWIQLWLARRLERFAPFGKPWTGWQVNFDGFFSSGFGRAPS